MLFQIYISNNFSSSYLPFYFYRETMRQVISEYITSEVEYIHNISSINKDPDTIIIMNMYCYIFSPDNVQEILEKYNKKVILISTEHYKFAYVEENIKKIVEKNLPYYILEYNVINYNYFTNTYPNLKIRFIPLIYNKVLENYYNEIIPCKIGWYQKDIDILFYGRLNDRRTHILDILKKRYNVCISTCGVSYEANKILCQQIERSKIVINILYYDYNIIFDYYRNSMLLANRVVLITEYPEITNLYLERSLVDFEKNLLVPKYDKIVETVDTILLYYNEFDINNLLDRQSNWFKNNDMKDILLPFLHEINN